MKWRVVPGPLVSLGAEPPSVPAVTEARLETIGAVPYAFSDFKAVAMQRQFDLTDARLRQLFHSNAVKIGSQAWAAQYFELKRFIETQYH